MPLELLQVTSAYSNAVLVAIMPHVADFAKKLELPIPPITTAQVRHFGCSPRADHIGGRVVLTNEYSFTFDRGAVVLYRSPRSYYSVQEPERIPEFYGTVKIKEDEVANIAHKALSELGYADAELHLDKPPKITTPPRSQDKQVARYLVEWLDRSEKVIPGGIPTERVTVEVDAASGQIQMLGIQNKNLRRPDPKLDVRPIAVANTPKSQPVGGTKIISLSQSYSNAFLVAILPQVSDFAKRAGFDLKLPITTNDIDRAISTIGLVENDPNAFCYLKTGERFVYRHGQVIQFDAHDAYRNPDPKAPFDEKPSEKFYGRVNVTEKEAMAVATKAVSQLSYAAQCPHLKEKPEVVPPRKEGTNFFARYFLNWWPDGEGMQLAVAEVDATTGKLKSLGVNDRANPTMWQAPPKIDVPMTSTSQEK